MPRHIPVLLNEVVDALNLKSGMNVADCTLGDGGHAEAILEKIGPKGKLLGIDADAESLLRAKQYLYNFGGRVIFVRDNFVHLKKIIAENKFDDVGAVLMDLGWSTSQFQERGRGFSFEKDEELDMRYDAFCHSEPRIGVLGKLREESLSGINEDRDLSSARASLGMTDKTAADILNQASEEELAKIFNNYGEEKLAKEIAAAIVAARKIKKIERTKELVEIILAVYRKKLNSDQEVPWVGGLHPATKVFQALRIAVNDEFEALRQALPQTLEILAAGGRLVVVAFHSLEDRIVKQYFQSVDGRTARLVNKKPIVAGAEELRANPRARSAKLRVVEKV